MPPPTAVSSRFSSISSHFSDECWKYARPRLWKKPHDDNFSSPRVCCGQLCLTRLRFHLRCVFPWPSVSSAATGARTAGIVHAARASTRVPVVGGSLALLWLLPCWPSSPRRFSPPRSSRNGAYSGKSRARRALVSRGEDQAQGLRIDQGRFRSSPRPEANKARSSRRTPKDNASMWITTAVGSSAPTSRWFSSSLRSAGVLEGSPKQQRLDLFQV